MFSSNLLPVRLFGRVMRWRLVYGRRGLAAGLHVGGGSEGGGGYGCVCGVGGVGKWGVGCGGLSRRQRG